MKRFFITLVALMVAMVAFGQEVTPEQAALKNEGNNLLRSGDHAGAFVKYEEYLQAIEYKDDVVVFNTGVCAQKLKDYSAMEKYFSMSIDNNYRLATSFQMLALAYQKQKKIAEMVSTLETGIAACPGQNSKLQNMYSIHFLKEGQKYQKANNVAKAAENYEKVLSIDDNKVKVNGLTSLGTLYFNDGASIMQALDPTLTVKSPEYASAKDKAIAKYRKAQAYLDQAQNLDPDNSDLGELIKQVKIEITKLS